MLLTHVCHFWRSLAQSTPTLWTDINVYFSPRYPVCKELNLACAIDHWVKFSGRCLLSIKILGDPHSGGDASSERIADTLCSASERWGRISFPEIESEDLSGASKAFYDRLLACNVPQLHSLSIPCFPDTEPFRSLWRSSSLLRAPKLRDLVMKPMIRRVGVRNTIPSLPIGWSTLTSLAIWGRTDRHTPFLTEYIATLYHCCNLVSLQIYDRTLKHNQTTTQFHEVELPCLRDLYLEISSISAMSALVSVLVTPAIQSFQVKHTYAKDSPKGSFAEILLRLLDRSGLTGNAGLRELMINPIYFSRSQFNRLLEALPAIEALRLVSEYSSHKRRFHRSRADGAQTEEWDGDEEVECFIDNIFLNRLCGLVAAQSNSGTGACSVHNTVLLPHLNDLELHARTSFSVQTFLQFIETKCRPSPTAPSGEPMARLCRILLVEADKVRYGDVSMNIQEVLRLLDPYKESGLFIELAYYCSLPIFTTENEIQP